MCGLAGTYSFVGEPASPVLLKRMGDAIAHRGPDSSGVFTDSSFGVVHRRLSIIDTSPAGHQPMSTRDQRYVISYNGEIYNYNELRVELESEGILFHTNTDTEVLLLALAHWGVAVTLPKLNGMFAFALWDAETKNLTIARDRYGIKPLYIYNNSGTLAFASEIKALLTLPRISAEIDYTGLQEYLTFQNFFGSKTLFKNIELFPPGSYSIFNSDGFKHSTQYWDFSFEEPENPATDAEYLEELTRLFSRAVKRQLVSDVEVGSYLSGGIDSGAITSIASQNLYQLKTFTCGFDTRSASGLELNFDERAQSEYMSYLFKTEHYEMVLKSGDMERSMLPVTYALEEPRVGQSYPNYYVSGLASKFVKVVLSGTGGDELFAGYPWRYYRAANNSCFNDYTSKYFQFWQRLVPDEYALTLLNPIASHLTNASATPMRRFRDVFPVSSQTISSPIDYINASLYFEAKTFLHSLLVVEDKLSMSHSLEARVPFLDNDLVDFAMKTPVHLKLGNLKSVIQLNENDVGSKPDRYFSKTNDGKLILRKALANHMPESVLSSVKQGFSAPDASWFQGESIDYVRSKLYNNTARIYEFLDHDIVIKLLDDHLQGKVNRRLFVWSMLTLETWLHLYL